MNAEINTPKELQDLQHIRQMMERSSRFVSLSGLSGIAAGIWSLTGAYIANSIIGKYYQEYNAEGYTGPAFEKLKRDLLLLAAGVLLMALVSAFYFTRKRARSHKVSIWNQSSKRLSVNLMIPLVTGGLLILGILRYDDWRFIAPLTLIFYGLALVNASKYTLTDIRYLGICEIILGLVNTQYVGYGLYFWAIGFGIFHIIYGVIMWIKYERTQA